MPAPKLSVVVPAYNEEGRIGETLRTAGTYLAEHHPDHQVVVVDDGSTDGTAALVQAVARDMPALALVGYSPNRGKGHAVRRGMLAATGRRRLFMDADLSTPMAELGKLMEALDAGADVAIGSRGMAASDLQQRQPAFRERMGKTFNLLVRAALPLGFADTQCGFKLFTAEAAEDLFGRATLDGFAFDVEVLSLARGRWRVAEVPIVWRHMPESRVAPGRDSLRMLRDLVRVRLSRTRGG